MIKSITWTSHCRTKMRFYGLGEGRVKRVLHSPERIETGIAPGTIAAMQAVKTGKKPYEIWVMLVEEKNNRRIVSAWKYPGRTKPRSEITFDFLKQEYDEFFETESDYSFRK